MTMLLDTIQFIAPAPDPITGGAAQTVGRQGIRNYWYWIIVNYPIGNSLAGPYFISNAPQTLDVNN